MGIFIICQSCFYNVDLKDGCEQTQKPTTTEFQKVLCISPLPTLNWNRKTSIMWYRKYFLPII